MHYSDDPNRCLPGGMIPVTTSVLLFTVPKFEAGPIPAGKVVVRNQNNQSGFRKKRKKGESLRICPVANFCTVNGSVAVVNGIVLLDTHLLGSLLLWHPNPRFSFVLSLN